MAIAHNCTAMLRHEYRQCVLFKGTHWRYLERCTTRLKRADYLRDNPPSARQSIAQMRTDKNGSLYFSEIKRTWIKRSPSDLAADNRTFEANCSVADPDGETSAGAALGTIAINASPPPTFDNPRDLAVITRFKRQSVARKLLNGVRPNAESWGYRVTNCLRSVIPGKHTVEVHHNPAAQSAHFKHLRTCDSVWTCPVCAVKITEKRRQQVMMLQARAHELGYVPIMITYTMRHNRGERLADLLTAFDAARRERFKAGKGWQTIAQRCGWLGSIRALEVTYGDHGWHVHAHELAFIQPITAGALEKLGNDLKTRWIASLTAVGADATLAHGLDVRAGDEAVYEYIAKFGREPKDITWSLAAEVTKTPTKTARKGSVAPFQLLDLAADGDSSAGDLFREYAAAFHNQRQLHTTPNLFKRLGIDKDEFDRLLDDMRPDAESIILAELSLFTWRQLLTLPRDVRGELLAVARRGDKAAFEAYLRYILESEGSNEIEQHSADVREVERTDVEQAACTSDTAAASPSVHVCRSRRTGSTDHDPDDRVRRTRSGTSTDG